MLSIVIPFYKRKYFRTTLESLSNQINKDFKVFIFNDNSPDEVEDLINEFSKTIDIEYFFLPKNTGQESLARFWNYCIDALPYNVSWFQILGDDDVLQPDFISNFHLYLNKHSNIKLFVNSTNVIDEKGVILKQYSQEQISPSQLVINKLSGKARLSLSEMIFHKITFIEKKFREYPLAWNSDLMIFLEIALKNDFFISNAITINIRVSSSSISGNQNLSVVKAKADMLFYIDLIRFYFNYFNRIQQKFLLTKLSEFYIHFNVSISDKLQLLYLMIKKLMLLRILKYSFKSVVK